MGAVKLKRRTIRTLATGAIAIALLVAIASAANWRLAFVAALTTGAIMLTRLRYAALVAVGVLAVTLALAQTGRSAGTDTRDVPAKTSQP